MIAAAGVLPGPGGMILAKISPATAALAAAGVTAGCALIGTVLAHVWAARQAERARKHELFASAFAAVVAYKEFAFAVRRRRCEPEHASAERVRVSEALREVQRELAFAEAMVIAEHHEKVTAAFAELVARTREIAGGLIRDGWNAAPITTDAEMNMPEVAEALAPLKNYEQAYLSAVREIVPPRWWLPLRRR
jgi:hypothetical protein